MARDEKIDGIKALLIFAMVLGHMSYLDYGIGISRMIYSFHMPAFVFLSGYFTSLKIDRHKMIKWVLVSLSVYFIAQWAQCLYSALVPFILHGKLGVVHIKEVLGLNPRFSLWYLLSLVFWRVGMAIIGHKLSDRLLITLSIIALVVGGIFPIDNQLSFQRTLAFSPFFVMGYLFKKNNISAKFDQIPLSVSFIIIPATLLYSRYLPTFVPSRQYAALIPYEIILRLFQSLIALLLTSNIINVLCSFPIEKLSRWGRFTLWIYIGHAIPITFQNKVVERFDIVPNLAVAICLSVLYVVGITMMAECITKKYEKRRNKSNGRQTR